MNKEIFIKHMERLLQIKKSEDNLNKAFRAFNPDFNYFSLATYETLVVDVLKEAMADEEDWIGWWLYENGCGAECKEDLVRIEGKTVPSSTLEDLYNLITNRSGKEKD